MREPDHPLPGRLQGRVARAIALEGRAVAVEREAVEFDDESVPRPEGVDLHPFDEDVARGRRDAVALAEGREAVLERGPRAIGGPCRVDQAPAASEAPAARRAVAEALERLQLQ